MNTALKFNTETKPLTLINTNEAFEKKINQTANELIDLFGWAEVSDTIKGLLHNDMKAFAVELLTPFTRIDAEQKQRKQRISYWMKQFKAGYCSESTLIEMLAN